jgi:hypothetical protein
MYDLVVGKVATCTSKPSVTPTLKSHTSHLYMTTDEFYKITVPLQSNVGFAKINEIFNPLSELGKLSEFKYKIVLRNARKFVNAVTGYLKEMEAPSEELPPPIQNDGLDKLPNEELMSNMSMVLKPAAVNNKQTSTANYAKRSVSLPDPLIASKKKRQIQHAMHVVFYTGKETTTHQAYSNK